MIKPEVLTWNIVEDVATNRSYAILLGVLTVSALDSGPRTEKLYQRLRRGEIAPHVLDDRGRHAADALLAVREVIGLLGGEVPSAPVVFTVMVDFLRPSYLNVGGNLLSAIAGKDVKYSGVEHDLVRQLPVMIATACMSAVGKAPADLIPEDGEELYARLAAYYGRPERSQRTTPEDYAVMEALITAHEIPISCVKVLQSAMAKNISFPAILWKAVQHVRNRKKYDLFDTLYWAYGFVVQNELTRMTNKAKRLFAAADTHLDDLLSIMNRNTLSAYIAEVGNSYGSVLDSWLVNNGEKIKLEKERRAEAERLKKAAEERRNKAENLVMRVYRTQNVTEWELDVIKSTDAGTYELHRSRLEAIAAECAQQRAAKREALLRAENEARAEREAAYEQHRIDACWWAYPDEQ